MDNTDHVVGKGTPSVRANIKAFLERKIMLVILGVWCALALLVGFKRN